MTVAAAYRRALRHHLAPKVRAYLNTCAPMRLRSRPSQIRAAANQIVFRAVAAARRDGVPQIAG